MQISNKEKKIGIGVVSLVLIMASIYFGETYRPVERISNVIAFAGEELSPERKSVEEVPLTQMESEYSLYVVKEGDTLYDISSCHEVDYQVVMTLNHLSSYTIKPGQKLRIPKYRS